MSFVTHFCGCHSFKLTSCFHDILETHASSGWTIPGLLLRSFLFVPVHSSRKLEKARSLRPDAFYRRSGRPHPRQKSSQLVPSLAAALPHAAGLPAKIFVRVNRFATSFFNGDMGVAVNRQVDGICSAQMCGGRRDCRLLWSAVMV